MDTVLGILSKVAEIFGKIGEVFGGISGVLSAMLDILNGFGTVIFLGGFLGLLFAFLWFLFRYLDKKRLTLPAVMFVLFLFIFIGGNLLLISGNKQAAEDTMAQAIGVEADGAEAPGSGDIRI